MSVESDEKRGVTTDTSRLRVLIAAAGVVVGLAVGLVAISLVDRPAEDEVARRVTVAGEDVGGLSRARLAAVVGRVADRYESAAVRVDAPRGDFSVPARLLGVRVREDATVAAALEVRKTGALPGRFWAWLTSFTGERSADVAVSAAEGRVWAEVLARDPGPKKPPVEPSVQLRDGKLTGVAGSAGRGIDPAQVLERLPNAARRGLPIVVAVDRDDVPPRFDTEAARRLARRAETLVRQPLAVTAGGARGEIPVATLRTWVTSKPGPDGLELAIDEAKAGTGLAKLLPGAGKAPVEARFSVSGGKVQVVGGQNGTACCDAKSGPLLARALLDRPTRPVELPLKTVEPKLTAEKAARLGIKEQVATFTTAHKAGEARVRNIHRIADLIRGQVIDPGETFSINGFVGRRTTERGFVSAPVIQEGHFTEDVGGGISQFATTLFNAAFLAGLDFGEYQSHTIYISRYPYGREATLAYPHPDLKIRNTTPHGVLIWPTYSASSITVSLYSTKVYDVTQSGQSKEPQGVCTKVRTERTRRPLAGGAPKVDAVFATYRPEEGVNCTGERTAPPTTTTVKR